MPDPDTARDYRERSVLAYLRVYAAYKIQNQIIHFQTSSIFLTILNSLASVHEMWYVHVYVNTMEIVNIDEVSESSFVRELLASLKSILANVDWLEGRSLESNARTDDPRWDIVIDLPLPGGDSAVLCVECKKDLRPSVFPSISGRTYPSEKSFAFTVRLLAMPWISPRMAELCREAGWGWFDLAGNCFIDIPSVLHVERTGNKPVHERRKARATLESNEAGRIVRLLLMPEEAATVWTQRKIQRESQPGVSLGLVNKVVRALVENSYLSTEGNSGLVLKDPEKLLYAWRDEYRFDRHERRGYFTLLTGNRLREALADLGGSSKGKAVYAAFSAADFQAPSVRQAKTWLFLSPALEDELRLRLDAKPVDSGENLVLLLPSDEGVFSRYDEGSVKALGLPCTNPVQTYVDLCHCGGRGAEAAEAVLNQRLKPAWRRQRLVQ